MAKNAKCEVWQEIYGDEPRPLMSKVQVGTDYVTLRPPLPHEEEEDFKIQNNTISTSVGDFVFDNVLHGRAGNDDVFSLTPVVDDLLNGINASLLCYGQTGSGKTHTMLGNEGDDGIIIRISKDLFKSFARQENTLEFTVNVSFMEIYMEKIRDLLSPSSSLSIKDSAQGIYVSNLSQYFVSTPQEIIAILENGLLQRRTSKTLMNETSSRSHAIFIIRISCKNTLNGIVKTGKLMLVDLAGSEKVKKTGASGQTLEEAKKINKSLSALGNVINALTSCEKHTHIPYRDSKLTRLLQDSIGGNSKTTLIINCSPSKCNIAETISTLRFGVRAKCIKNHIRVNQELPPTEYKKLLHAKDLEYQSLKNYSQKLELELKKWRLSGHVPLEEWVDFKELPVSDWKLEKIDSKIDFEEIPHMETKEFLERELEFEELMEEKEAAIVEKDEIILELEEKLRQMELKINIKHEYINVQDSKTPSTVLDIETFEKDGKLEVSEGTNANLIPEISNLSQSLSTIFEEALEEQSIARELPSQSITLEDTLLDPSLASIRHSQSTVFVEAFEERSEAESRDEFFEPRAISDKEMQKMFFLEQSLDQLSKIQKQLVEQNLELKKSISISEKKLLSRTEKIQELEKSLEEAQEKLANNDDSNLDTDKHTFNPFFHPRIVKPLRGGTKVPTEISTPGSKNPVWYINLVKTPK